MEIKKTAAPFPGDSRFFILKGLGGIPCHSVKKKEEDVTFPSTQKNQPGSMLNPTLRSASF
jgi:hypothetical protein